MSQKLKVEQLNIEIFDEVVDMGFAAANFVEQKINAAIVDKGVANIILATGTSQFSFLNALKKKDIDWKNVIVFHYIFLIKFKYPTTNTIKNPLLLLLIVPMIFFA